MSAPHLGFYNTSGTRTFVRFIYPTFAAAGGNVAPSTAIDAADIRIYKATDGAAFSATQRSSSNGITSTSPFDSLTGLHEVDIDLTDNSDAGFYAVNCVYMAVFAPNDETIDSQTITGAPLFFFEIGVQPVNAVQLSGTVQAAGDLVTLLNAIDDLVDTEVAAIKAKTDNLPADPADASDIAASFASLNTKVDAIDDFLDTEIAAILAAVDTEVAAIKVKTDPMTYTKSNELDSNTRSVHDVTILGDGAGTPFFV